VSARVIVVHDEPGFIKEVVPLIVRGGYQVAAFTGSIDAWDALRGSQPLDLLITQICFAPGKPHGISLAQWARAEHLGAKILFIGPPELSEHVADLGMLIPPTLGALSVVDVMEWVLNADEESPPH
jgi:DNA-binding NtrC family response regulator